MSHIVWHNVPAHLKSFQDFVSLFCLESEGSDGAEIDLKGSRRHKSINLKFPIKPIQDGGDADAPLWG